MRRARVGPSLLGVGAAAPEQQAQRAGVGERCTALPAGGVAIGEAVPVEPGTDQPVVTVFRSRLRDDAETNGYAELAEAMEARARQMPGFVDFKTFVAPDGERLSLVVFDSVAHHQAWRDDPEHRSAQRRGRDDFYLEYTISVCRQIRHRHFAVADAPGPDGES